MFGGFFFGMKLPALFLAGAVALATSAPAQVESPNTNSTPPGPAEEASAAKPQPETSAPAQAQTKSAKGGQSPNGANGVNLKGKAVTKSPHAHKKPAGSTVAATSSSSAPVAQNASPAQGIPGPSTPATPKTSVLDNYLAELGSALKLSADEKKDIQSYYQADGVQMAGILGDGSLSPLKQAQEISDARDQCLAKVEALLAGTDRLRDFLPIEEQYRVALIEAAATKAALPGSAPAPVPTPTNTFPGEASAAPNPDVKPK
jgi:hypothetical protein